MKPVIRKSVLGMQAYVPGRPISDVQREHGFSKVVKLASNENPLGPSPRAVDAVVRASGSMHLYPDASGYELKEALAKHHGVGHENIVLGNGSDEIIAMLGAVLLEPGTNIVTGAPTFVRYASAGQLAGAEVREVPLDSGWKHNLDAMASACDSGTRMVFLANPHNPTGTVVEAGAVDRLRAEMPDSALLVLDQAYFEYAEGVIDQPDAAEMVRSGLSVVGLRTFSKAYGLAGIRVGYAVVPEWIYDAIDRSRQPFDVNSLAQAAAIAALGDTGHLARSREANLAGISRLVLGAESLGLKTVPSHANFVCIEVGGDDRVLFDQLLRRGVIVRPGTPLGMPGYLRVSVGTEEELDEFLSVLGELVPVGSS